MKKILTIALALFLLAVTVMPVMAASGPVRNRTPRGPFALVGTITAIDPVTGVVTVNVVNGNKLAQTVIGQDLAIVTTANTRFLYKTSPTTRAIVITFADLVVGEAVSVHGRLASEVWTATRITGGASLACFP
jgi:hypothetical protein